MFTFLARREKQLLLDLRLFANGPFMSSNFAYVLIRLDHCRMRYASSLPLCMGGEDEA